jgi:hypothetical protein
MSGTFSVPDVYLLADLMERVGTIVELVSFGGGSSR